MRYDALRFYSKAFVVLAVLSFMGGLVMMAIGGFGYIITGIVSGFVFLTISEILKVIIDVAEKYMASNIIPGVTEKKEEDIFEGRTEQERVTMQTKYRALLSLRKDGIIDDMEFLNEKNALINQWHSLSDQHSV